MPTFREQFHHNNLSIVHEEPIQFITSQWQDNKLEPNVKYVFYRLCYFVYVLVTFILALKPGFFSYLTNWGYTLLLVQSWIVLMMLTVSIIGRKCARNCHWQSYVLKLHPFYWCINTCSNSVGFDITISYWILVAIYGQYLEHTATCKDIITHAFNSLVIVLDLFIVQHPVYVVHFVYPLIFGVAYSIYSVIHYFYDTNRGGPGYIYGVFDWGRPYRAAPLMLILLLFVVLLHFLMFGMFRLRQRVYKKLRRHNMVEDHDHENSRQTNYA